MALSDGLYALFLRNFPCAVREEATARRILAREENRVFDRRDATGSLVAACVLWDSAILLLAVDAPYRGRGWGRALLAEAEAAVAAAGHDRVVIGAGADYLVPGVPVRTPPYAEGRTPLEDPRLTDDAWHWLECRGYRHGWADANCFDMRLDMAEMPPLPHQIGEVLKGVLYRWAVPEDREAASRCAGAAEEGFAPYYLEPAYYRADNAQRVLVAEEAGQIVGVLMVCRETEGPGLGSIGCTAVLPACQGRGIASCLVRLGTAHLKALGLPRGFLGYTYSGLDRLYGKAGFRVCCYYAMAEKRLTEEKK